MSSPTAPPEKAGRIAQLRYTYAMTSQTHPMFGVYVLLAAVLGGAVGFTIFWFTMPFNGWGRVVAGVLGALLVGFSLAATVFLKIAQSSGYKHLRGQIGAAAGAMGMLNKSWKVIPMVAVTRQQDIVHRLVGPPGVILVGEGDTGRLKTLFGQERKRYARVLPDTVPLYDVICGDGEGQVPLEKLNRHVIKLGRKIEPSTMTDVLNRLKAYDASRPIVPLPKGPIGQMRGSMKQAQRGR